MNSAVELWHKMQDDVESVSDDDVLTILEYASKGITPIESLMVTISGDTKFRDLALLMESEPSGEYDITFAMQMDFVDEDAAHSMAMAGLRMRSVVASIVGITDDELDEATIGGKEAEKNFLQKAHKASTEAKDRVEAYMPVIMLMMCAANYVAFRFERAMATAALVIAARPKNHEFEMLAQGLLDGCLEALTVKSRLTEGDDFHGWTE